MEMGMATFTVGTTVKMRGYILKAMFLRGQSAAELERRLGYRTGRLVKGWYLFFLLQMPTINDFTMRGYTHFPDGVPVGGTAPPEPAMIGRGWSPREVEALKRNLVKKTFRITGPERLAKVIPVIDHSDVETYPPGSGIPQWRLGTQLEFKVKAFIPPGQVYAGDYND